MPRKIIIPDIINERLKKLTGLIEEVNGVLLYRQRGQDCPVEGMYVTGGGDEGHVESLPDRIRVVNEFFERNLEYKFVKFHTHTLGTIARFGDYYATHFSQGDIEDIKEQLKHSREFIAMLITPETTLLSGIGNPTMEIVKDSREYKECRDFIEKAFEQIARELGVENEMLRGRRL